MITHPNTKINLGLRVLRRRADGYHDIETVFVPYFGLCDTLEIVRGDDYSRTSADLFERYSDGKPCKGGEKIENSEVKVKQEGSAGNLCEPKSVNEKGESESGDDEGNGRKSCCGGKIRQGIAADGKCMITIAREEGIDWEPTEDLCVRAYQILDADFSLPPVKIFLEKTVPVGAGLGGGSADAAFTLRMLSELFDLNLDDNSLSEYAARLGSDCPFFIWNTLMYGTGRGEILSPIDLPQLEGCEIRVVVLDGIRISTAEAYHGIVPRDSSCRGNQIPTLCDNQDAIPHLPQEGVVDTGDFGELPLIEVLQRPLSEWKDLVVNDFEANIFPFHPELSRAKSVLYADGAIYAAMSGTGSALFGIFPR